MTDSRFTLAAAMKGFRVKRWQENLLVLLLYFSLTIAMTYPAVLFLNRKVPGGPEDNFHFLWELWYVAHALFDLHKSPFFDPDVYVPFGYSLIRNQDLSPGTVLLFSPLTHLFGEVFTFNFLVLASFPLTAFGTYLLARQLWSNRLAAFLAGLIVGFCPYRFAHAGGHLSIVSTQWIPFFFLYLERLISKPRLRSAVLAGIFFGLSSWTTWYYFFMVSIAAAFYVAFRIDWKLPARDLRHLFKLGLTSTCVAAILVLPFLVPYYLATHGAKVDYRGPGESQAFAAALADYIIPPTTHPLWGTWAARLWRNGPNGLWQSEWQLYVGAVALLLAVVFVFQRRRRRVVIALVAMALGCLVFSFGPGIYLTHPPPLSAGTNDVPLSSIPAPGRFLLELPGFNNLHAWSRLGFFVQLAVGILAAGGLSLLLDWMKERYPGHVVLRVALATLVIALASVDFLPGALDMTPVTPRPVDRWLSMQPGSFVFMEYPIPDDAYSGPAMYSTRLTGKRIIMGYASSPPNFAFWSELSAFPSPVTLDRLYEWGTKYVLVDENRYRAGSSFWNIYQTWDTLKPGIEASSRLKEVAVLDRIHVYELDSGTQQHGIELLPNGSFEGGSGSLLPGWRIVGHPRIDRTGKYSSNSRVACAVTPKDFLLSEPVAADSGQCYRLSVRHMAASARSGKPVLQLDWKGEGKDDLHLPSVSIADARSTQQWQELITTVRAPAGSKYAVLRAAAASGKIWIDDVSLKNSPADCEPVLFVTPSQVYVQAGQLGRAAISWKACCNSEARVTSATNEATEQLLANGQSGLSFFDGIKPGMRYEFRLYSDQQTIPAQTAQLTSVTATIAADPNPVPPAADTGLGRTIIAWTTLAKTDADVWVSQNGGPEQLFASGASGSAEASWIASGSTYEFRLYSRQQTRRLLTKVVVTTVKPEDHNAIH